MTNQLTETQKQLIAMITQFIVASLALYNFIAPQFDLPAFVLGNEVITGAVTFVVIAVIYFYNAYKNRNVSWQSQLSQQVLDGLKSGLVAPEAVQEMLDDAQDEMNQTTEELNAEIEQEVNEFMERQEAIEAQEENNTDNSENNDA